MKTILRSLSFKTSQEAKSSQQKARRWTIEMRYDIMNKNLIRAIKREYKAFYDDSISIEEFKTIKSHLIKNTELFASELLANTSIRWWEVDGFNAETLRDYLLALTQYCMYKKIYVDKQGAENKSIICCTLTLMSISTTSLVFLKSKFWY